MDETSEVTDLSCRSLPAIPRTLLSQPNHAILELNLAFNEIVSIDGIVEACPQLQRLMAAHNKIQTLPALHTLQNLVRVDVSSNQLRTIAPLHRCKVLSELWAASNQLTLAAAVALRTASSLRTLVLMKNPCDKAQPGY